MNGRLAHGPLILEEGGVEFRLWAPGAKRVDVVTSRDVPMERAGDGWFRAMLSEAHAGTRYSFRIDEDLIVPDPASGFQPDDVFGASEVIDHRYEWKSTEWRGRHWHDAVILELHIGTFTPSGTYLGAIEKLDHVVRTGFTAVELMPVGDFHGRWNWGYDGVLWFAPDSAYGRPEDLKAFIDAAHARGLMVFLDVVYNHFGPEGNYLPRYAPQFFAPEKQTPWGAAIDYSVPQVRAFTVQNALHWIDHYRFDGLRLDAVHAIARRADILSEISKAVGEFADRAGREIHLVLENESNEASLLSSGADGTNGKYRAQWNDDYHHAWHVLLTGETSAHYADYAGDPASAIARVLSAGFFHQGDSSEFRGAPRGEPSAHLSPTAFVSFLQNHDQIGNRALGERLDSLASSAANEAALAIMLLAPNPPLLFMGQEWGETRPFQFFCDFRGELAQAVREGRREEFGAAYALLDPATVPDPLSELTVAGSVVDWEKLTQSAHRQRWQFVRRLLETRKNFIAPCLANLREWSAEASVTGRVLSATWQLDGKQLHLRANLNDVAVEAPRPPGTVVWNHDTGEMLSPWSVFWTLEE